MAKKGDILAELEEVRRSHKGLLRPPDVVAYAENPETELHGCFLWDNDRAGHQYRLWQARELIRVSVEVVAGFDEPVSVYVSLRDDRKAGHGYRALADVLTDARRRKMLLVEALDDFRRMERKYAQLKELAEVFAAARRVRKRNRKK